MPATLHQRIEDADRLVRAERGRQRRGGEKTAGRRDGALGPEIEAERVRRAGDRHDEAQARLRMAAVMNPAYADEALRRDTPNEAED